MHPAARLATFIVVAVFTPQLSCAALAGFCLCLLCLLAASGCVRAYGKLLWHSKYVLLALSLAHVLSGAFDSAALRSWLHSTLYLLALLAALLLLVLSLPRDRLLSGLVTLLRPLGAFKLPIQSFCVRTMLTLEYAAALRGQPWRELLAQVTQPANPASSAGTEVEVIEVLTPPWRWVDRAVPVAVGGLLAGCKYMLN